MKSIQSFIATILLILLAACAPEGVKVRGHDARDFFEDEKVVELCAAVANGDLLMIDRLVEEGTNVNTVGKDGMTPLMWAFLAENKAAFQRLLELDADPHVLVWEDESVMSFVTEAENIDYLRIALEYGGDPNWYCPRFKKPLLGVSLIAANVESAKLLIKMGADPNGRDASGQPILMLAAVFNRYDLVELMLEAGADYTMEDNWGYTLVDTIEEGNIAQEGPHYQWRQNVIDYLRERGVEVKKPKY